MLKNPKLCLRLQRGGGLRGWGRDDLGTGARGRGARARRALMSTCMKPAGRVKSRCVAPLTPPFCVVVPRVHVRWAVALVSRGSVSLVFALVKGEEHSPAHEGIRRVGAPSTQRPCNSGQGNIRAHPPVEPARDHHRLTTPTPH